jgi:hypothetical protein
MSSSKTAFTLRYWDHWLFRMLFLVGFSASFMVGCSDQRSAFNEKLKSNRSGAAPEDKKTDDQVGIDPNHTDQTLNPDPKNEIGKSGETRVATYNIGPKVSPADFLMVVDNSGSMQVSRNKVFEGFKKVAPSAWPIDSRIAVMSTMPARFSDLSRPHENVSLYSGIETEPGFLSFVDKVSIEKYRTNGNVLNPAYKAAFAEPGCDAWFKPADVNASKTLCLNAHLQNPMTGIGAEAGLTAVKQILEKNKDQKLFRDNGFLHIIFISDTHDPGIDSQALRAAIPNFEGIKKILLASNNLTGVKLHGIVPTKATCSSEMTHDFSYLNPIRDSGGITYDYCLPEPDYSSVAKQVVASSSPEAIIAFNQEFSSIVKVLIDGVPYTGKIETVNSITIKLSDLAILKDTAIEVTFVVK